MNIRIYSKQSLNRMLEEHLYKAYQEGSHSVDFLLLFPVEERDKDPILQLIKSYDIVLDARWRFKSVIFTAYIRH